MKNQILFAVFWGCVGSLLTCGGLYAALKIDDKRIDCEHDDFKERVQAIIDGWPVDRFTDEQKEELRKLGYRI